MELSLLLNYLKPKFGGGKRDIAEMASLCRGAGFKYVDHTSDFKSDEWKDIAYRERRVLDDAGITVEQTHAPFNRY